MVYTLDCPVGHGEYQSELVDEECPSCTANVACVPNPQNNRVPFYRDSLNVDAQVSVEQMIAATLFDECRTDEETAQALSQQILLNVLAVFRKDLIGYHLWEVR